MHKEQIIKDAIEALIYTGFALFGSIARTLSDNFTKGKRGWALAFLMLSNAAIAGFCGLLVMPLARVLKLDIYAAMIVASMAGWMGIVFLNLIEKQITRRLENGTNSDH